MAAAAEVKGALDKVAVAALAEKHGVEPIALTAWLRECVRKVADSLPKG